MLKRFERDSDLPLKLLVVAGTKEDAQNLDHHLDGALSGARSVVTDAGRGVVEILPTDVNKASAIRRVLQARGIAPETVATFGDSENDLEMLREFALGFAMGNGVEAAKAEADEILGRDDPAANDKPVIAAKVRSLLPLICNQQ